jgi:hypothetical protein
MAKLYPDNSTYQVIARILKEACAGLQPDPVLMKRVALDKMVKFWGNLTFKGLLAILNEHVATRNPISQVKETREEYCREHEFHYDFVVPAPAGSKYPKIYVEARLDDGARDQDSWRLIIVSIHPPNRSNP